MLQESLQSFTSKLLAMQSDMRDDVADIKRQLASSCMVSPQDLDSFGTWPARPSMHSCNTSISGVLHISVLLTRRQEYGKE